MINFDNTDLQSWFQAASQGNTQHMRDLLAAGRVEVNVADRFGNTATHLAASRYQIETLKVLITEMHADVNKMNRSLRTPLHQASITERFAGITAEEEAEAAEVLNILIKIGKATVNTQDEKWGTALHAAAISGNTATLRVLLEVGEADIEARDYRGRTALFYAVNKGYTEVVRMLVNEFHADIVKATTLDSDCITTALSNKNFEIVEILQQQGRTSIPIFLFPPLINQPSNIDPSNAPTIVTSRLLKALVQYFEHADLQAASQAFIKWVMSAPKNIRNKNAQTAISRISKISFTDACSGVSLVHTLGLFWLVINHTNFKDKSNRYEHAIDLLNTMQKIYIAKLGKVKLGSIFDNLIEELLSLQYIGFGSITCLDTTETDFFSTTYLPQLELAKKREEQFENDVIEGPLALKMGRIKLKS